MDKEDKYINFLKDKGYKEVNIDGQFNFKDFGVKLFEKNNKTYIVKITDDLEADISNKINKLMKNDKLCEKLLVSINEIYKYEKNVNFMVMDYYGNNSIFNEYDSLENNVKKLLILQIVIAIKCLHDRNIIHSDIKPDNLFGTTWLTFVLGDYGFSSINGEGNILVGAAGMPPETFGGRDKRKIANFAIDIWALGILLYSLNSKDHEDIFPNNRDRLFIDFETLDKKYNYRKMLKDNLNKIGEKDPQLQDLLSKMLVINPNKRININEVLSHPWFVEKHENKNLYEWIKENR